MNTINKNKFQKMSAEWTAIDTEYDNLFQDFLDNPQELSSDQIEKFQSMQKRLYAIEDELYEIAKGNKKIVE